MTIYHQEFDLEYFHPRMFSPPDLMIRGESANSSRLLSPHAPKTAKSV